VIITTVRESEYPNSITVEIAQSLISDKVWHFHSDDADGSMATQLNYALNKIYSLIKRRKSSEIIYAVYNVDSRPEPKTFDWVINNYDFNLPYVCFQQYGDYSKNIAKIANSSQPFSLSSSAFWQNRWTLGFEMANALGQYKKFKLIKNSWRMNYCVGHGVFISQKLLGRIGGFSDKTHNEDIFLGLAVSNLNIRIKPIPYFDLADSPDDLRYLYKQKTNWFMGTFQVNKYYKIIRNSSWFDNNTPKLLFQTSQVFRLALYWIFGPSILFFSFIYSIMCQDIVSILVLALVIIEYLVIPNALGQYLIKRAQSKTVRFKQVFIISLLGSWVSSLVHGLSAYNSIKKYLVQKFFGVKFIKGKTDMRF